MELEQQAKFDRLVRELEKTVRTSAQTYHLKVTLLTALGYGYIALLSAGVFSSLWLMKSILSKIHQQEVAIDSSQLSLLVGLGLLATFWVQYTPLKDRKLQRHECPELFATIERLQSELNAPPLHHIVINSEHNAAVYQAPRWGCFGGYRNYLILGLPLMQSLSPEQFTATLAHEIGHLSGNDSRFVGWIYRVRFIWEQLTRDNNLFFLQWFFRWYEPLIKAYSFVLVRDREYAADLLARNLTSPEIAASDLIQTYVYQSYLQASFQTHLSYQAKQLAAPPANIVSQMLSALRQPLDPGLAQQWLGLALSESTDTEDTHPCLRDRLMAVGYQHPPEWYPTSLKSTAAEYFFGDRLADVTSELDLRWQDENTVAWHQQYQRSLWQQEHLDFLKNAAQTRELNHREMIAQATVTEDLQGVDIALDLWLEIIDRDPNCAIALHHAGKILLDRQDDRGIDYLERSIALDVDLIVPSCEELYGYYLHQNRRDRSQIYLDLRAHYLPQQWRSKLEHQLKPTDRFKSHDLSISEIEDIVTIIEQFPILRAYLVCKPIQIIPDYLLYILAIEIAESNRNCELSERLKIALSCQDRWLISIHDRHNSSLNRQIERVPNSRII
jgi:Zn-dependent protease with chaperone function